MNKLLIRAIPATAFAALTLASTLPAAAAQGEEPFHGPRCADIVDGAVSYTTQFGQTDPTVIGEAVLGAPACRSVRYTLVVFDETTSTAPLATLTGTATTDGAGRPVVQFEEEVVQESEDGTVCVVFETRIGKRLLDRAPDEGCAELLLDGAPPGKRFR